MKDKLMFENLDQEFKDFMGELFNKYDIELNEELVYDIPLEHDFYNILNDLESYLRDVLQKNKELNEEG